MTRRFFIALLAVSVVVLGVFAFVSGKTAQTELEQRSVIDIEREAYKLAILVQDDLERHPGPAGVRQIKQWAGAVADQERSTIAVTDRNGNLIAFARRAGPPALRVDVETHAEAALQEANGDATAIKLHVEGREYELVRVPIVANQEIVGAVVVAKQASQLSGAAGRQARFLTPLLVLALGLSALLAFIAAQAVVRPLRQLVRATRAIATDDGAPARAPVVGPKEVRELAEALNTMSVRVRRTLDRQNQFASDVAHQLRTPLTTIGTGMEQLRAQFLANDLDGVPATYLRVRGEVTRMKRLVEGLLVLARTVDGEAERVPVDIADVAHARAEAWVDLAREEGVRIEIEAPIATFAWVVPGAFEQILDNVIENAVEAAPVGSVIRIAVASETPDVVATVSDAGPGLSATDQKRAFERFWRGDTAAGGEDGFGIGLTIVRDLVHASGGDVELVSGPDGGTTAVVRLESADSSDTDPSHPGRPAGATTAQVARYLRLRAPENARTLAREVWRTMGENGAGLVEDPAYRIRALTIARNLTVDQTSGVMGPGATEVERAISRLSGVEADVIALATAGLDTDETAAVLERSVSRVRRARRRALARLTAMTSEAAVAAYLGSQGAADSLLVPTAGRSSDERGAVVLLRSVDRARGRRPRRSALAISFAAFGSLTLASVAAANGSLPDAVQHVVARAASHVGISVPDPGVTPRPAVRPTTSVPGGSEVTPRVPAAGTHGRTVGTPESGVAPSSVLPTHVPPTHVPVPRAGSSPPSTSGSVSVPTTTGSQGNGAGNGQANGVGPAANRNGAANGNGNGAANGNGNGNGAANGNANGAQNGNGNGAANGNGNGAQNGKAKGLATTPTAPAK